jgi:hypothetical protein
VVTFLGRLIVWTMTVALDFTLAVLRPALLVIGEVLTVAVRVGLHIFSYPEAWAVTAIVVLWLFTNRSTIPSAIAVVAIIATLTATFVRSRL